MTPRQIRRQAAKNDAVLAAGGRVPAGKGVAVPSAKVRRKGRAGGKTPAFAEQGAGAAARGGQGAGKFCGSVQGLRAFVAHISGGRLPGGMELPVRVEVRSGRLGEALPRFKGAARGGALMGKLLIADWGRLRLVSRWRPRPEKSGVFPHG